ncbi:BTAD domain-containing putative transcriptional regulator [Actinoplanes sp. URMC 104]|uniref:BTAD domain-containing putative transcriptional regulator n=1 Tax=Actinoplanes sp. URMC 104 TaxID=3423409 RepID=UPI003F1AD481
MFRLIAALRWMLAAAVLLIGAPLGFAVGGGLPHQMPSVQQVQMWSQAPLEAGNAAITAWIAVWLIWSVIAGLVVAAILRRVARVRWERLVAHLPAPMQGLVATVVGATALTAPLAASTAHAAPPSAASGDTHDVSPGIGSGHQPTPQAALDAAAQAASTSRDHVIVREGDTLSSIAERCLGDANAWPAIFALNRGTDYPDVGGRFTDPDVIYPGWTLKLPPTATTPNTPDHVPPARSGTDEPRPEPTEKHDPSAPTSSRPPAPATTTAPAPTEEPGGANTAPGMPAEHSATYVPTPNGTPGASDASPGVQLTSGSWLEAGLATAVAAAAALIWAHRRRRYHRRPLSPELRLDDPDLAAMPPVVTEIRRRLRIMLEPATTASTATSTALIPAQAAEAGDDDADRSGPAAGLTKEAADGPQRPGDTRPVAPTLTKPVAVAWPTSGLGLTGPGAVAAARGFLATAVANSDPQAPAGRVVLPAITAVMLFGDAGHTLPAGDRVTITTDLEEALNLLEQQILQRTRLLQDHEADTIAGVRTADPHEQPAPPILLLADATDSHNDTRIAALLSQGHRFDIHGILLGDWPSGDTVVVDTDGSTTPAATDDHSQQLADLDRVTVLTQADALAVLATLLEAHTGPPHPQTKAHPLQTTAQPPATPGTADGSLSRGRAGRVLRALAELGDATAAAVAAHLDVPYPTATAELVQREHDGHTEIIRTDTGRTLWRLTEAGRAATDDPDIAASSPAHTEPVTNPPSSTGEISGGTASAAGRYAELDTALRWPDRETVFTSEPPADAPGDDNTAPGHVDVKVLGPARIVAAKPDRTLRKKALELLVYLAVHDGSATVDAILEDLLPDAPASKASERLYTYVSDLRAVMRRIGGPATYVTHPNRRYALNTDTIDVDLWRMRAAIREAHQATNPQQRITALHRVVTLYQGPLAEDTDYEWAEPYREAIRQQALDAHLALADALTGNPTDQARVLEAAIAHSPYSEQLYRDAMRAYAELGRPDAIRTLRRNLTRALAEIDAEPDDRTMTLADELIAGIQQFGR